MKRSSSMVMRIVFQEDKFERVSTIEETLKRIEES